MTRITKTRELAHAAGWDAGNRNMRANGRTGWNAEDYQIACDTMNRLWPEDEYWDDFGIAAELTPRLPSIMS